MQAFPKRTVFRREAPIKAALLQRSSLGLCSVRMRSFIALPAAVALAITTGCGHDAHVASPAATTSASAATNAPVATPIAAATPSDSAEALGAARPPSSAALPIGAEPAPAPIDADLPSSEALTLSNKASCPAKICRLEGSLLEAMVGSAESQSPAGIWEEDLGSGATASFARRADMDILGVVLSGKIALAADEVKGRSTDLSPWHAFVAPGAGITLRALGGPARIVLFLVGADAPAGKVAASKSAAWTARPAAVPDLAWGKGAYHARIGFAADRSPRASLGILRMSDGGIVAPHVHDKEWEHMAILQGEGDFVLGEGEAERTLHASDGSTFSVPPATRHKWRSAGSRAFVGIQVYTPPGPEQRFKKLAAAP
jgi:mannose-6-phosphate isomerase-like protein (cupin superfamily)